MVDLEVNLRLEIMVVLVPSGERSEVGQFRVREKRDLMGMLQAAGINYLGADSPGGNYRGRMAARNCLPYP